ncbi:helix-turn-helix domain-containing protein [Paenibacillus sp. WQ 127069]|uniref:Helix-turn-helix domain-containing protein n=1 Tax=Paenibacillus baimaensis TaxID=2982185 RepID=A0ABT2UCY4_9BACL|nr:helix-turn-helix transcriptional regulator [Paenibacillus sp. WQ 127069]MCU6792457.1 helix-turn-helix domain-containing protein [Paenibacillus sp. WQ 127069]
MNIEACFGRHLRKIREEKRLSQEELAFRSNLDRTYISLLERGKRRPTINTIFALAKPLDIAPSDMVKLIESDLATDVAEIKQ